MTPLPSDWTKRTVSVRGHVFGRREFARVYILDTVDGAGTVLDRELVIERGTITKQGMEKVARKVGLPLAIARKLGLQIVA